MQRDEETRNRLGEAFHDAFRGIVLSPKWNLVNKQWRDAVLKGVDAVLAADDVARTERQKSEEIT